MELLEQIQEHVQGEYIYIPIKEKYAVDNVTDYKIELEKRDAHIYTNYLEGMSNQRLSKIYNLSESSIRRIIIKKRKGYEEMKEKIIKVLMSWDLQDSSIEQIYQSTWQVENDYVLKVYQDKESLERNI